MSISTQDFLEISEIKDGIILLKNGGLRIALMVSSLNFALKSEEEQEAIIYQFQNFLNSLDFFCQILVQSRQLNMTGYLDKLKTLQEKETNQLLKTQINDYLNFISSILEKGKIMQKSFYVIIPFSPMEVQSPGPVQAKKIMNLSKISDEDFKRAKIQIWQRAEFVALGLRSCGLETVPLNSSELIELFWSLHHQEEAERGYYPDIPPEFIQ